MSPYINNFLGGGRKKLSEIIIIPKDNEENKTVCAWGVLFL